MKKYVSRRILVLLPLKVKKRREIRMNDSLKSMFACTKLDIRFILSLEDNCPTKI